MAKENSVRIEQLLSISTKIEWTLLTCILRVWSVLAVRDNTLSMTDLWSETRQSGGNLLNRLNYLVSHHLHFLRPQDVRKMRIMRIKSPS